MELKKYKGAIKKWEDMLPGYCGYMRMYYRNHRWAGTWFPCTENTFTDNDLIILNALCRAVAERWPDGCSHPMVTEVKSFAASVEGNHHHHLLEIDGAEFHYLVFINLEFGNADYPIRIYTYRK